jgi:hypothetical protein
MEDAFTYLILFGLLIFGLLIANKEKLNPILFEKLFSNFISIAWILWVLGCVIAIFASDFHIATIVLSLFTSIIFKPKILFDHKPQPLQDSSRENIATCPRCGTSGIISIDGLGAFDIRGQFEGKGVWKCNNCGSGLFSNSTIGIVDGKLKLIPDEVWNNMKRQWGER